MVPLGVHDACRRFDRGDVLWANGLARELDDIRPGLAYEWMKRCAKALLSLHGSPNAPELTRDLNDLDAFEASRPTVEEIDERARAIWYRPNRDIAQAALSKLYSFVPASNAPIARVRSPSVVNLLVDRAPDRASALLIAITEFNHIKRSSP